MVSPLVEIFSNAEDQDNKLPKQSEANDTSVSLTEVEENENKNVAYSAPGTAADDGDVEDIESEVEDSFD
jgi:hypothetical protein